VIGDPVPASGKQSCSDGIVEVEKQKRVSEKMSQADHRLGGRQVETECRADLFVEAVPDSAANSRIKDHGYEKYPGVREKGFKHSGTL
jgi:hypothetical protein